VQASSEWVPPTGTLGRILEETRRRIPSLEMTSPWGSGGEVAIDAPAAPPSLKVALMRDTVAVIAELKRRSPSKGSLNEDLDPQALSEAFERGGAAAISVLTEPAFFGGSLQDMAAARRAVRLPILKKDFHIHRSQLVEARIKKASAVLLIARALSPRELPELVRRARSLHLEAVVEVRSERELERALEAGAEIVGVNSRDLETLEVDENVPRALIPKVPPSIIAIWESGVESVDDVRRAADCGADAVLVGTVLSRAADPALLLHSLTKVQRQPRRG